MVARIRGHPPALVSHSWMSRRSRLPKRSQFPLCAHSGSSFCETLFPPKQSTQSSPAAKVFPFRCLSVRHRELGRRLDSGPSLVLARFFPLEFASSHPTSTPSLRAPLLSGRSFPMTILTSPYPPSHSLTFIFTPAVPQDIKGNRLRVLQLRNPNQVPLVGATSTSTPASQYMIELGAKGTPFDLRSLVRARKFGRLVGEDGMNADVALQLHSLRGFPGCRRDLQSSSR